jgi:hypothetical protein
METVEEQTVEQQTVEVESLGWDDVVANPPTPRSREDRMRRRLRARGYALRKSRRGSGSYTIVVDGDFEGIDDVEAFVHNLLLWGSHGAHARLRSGAR